MSGHNKWSSIKHRKGAQDAKKGKIFTKISKELTVAARMGGGDPSGNARLRLAIANARAAHMPADTMTRAIKKGTGELEADQIHELMYEGYGHGGVAFLIEVATDNPNRSSSEIRNLFEKSGGNWARSGAVSFLFHRRGMIRYEASRFSEEKVMEGAIEAGAEDVVTEGDDVVVYTDATSFHSVKDALDKAGFESSSAELVMVPTTSTAIKDVDAAKKTLALYHKLSDHEDVQNVYANFDIPDEIMNSIGE